MENLFESLVSLQDRLRKAGIPSAVIGGVAVSVWGEPRLTRDVDFKVRLTRQDAPRLLKLLTPDYTPLVANPAQTLARTGILFVQDSLGTRLDLLLSDTPFDAEVIRRTKQVELEMGREAHICSAEDLIIYKLISTRLRDYEDAASVIRRQGDALDDAYVLSWLRRFEQALDDPTLIAEYRRMRRIT